jgi:ribosomal protein S18 acetylase RimI-like enzyme
MDERISREEVISELRETCGDEFDYDGEVASINACLASPSSAEVGHFVVAREFRRQGIGSILFESLCEVLAENDVRSVVVEIQAVDDGSEGDGVMSFLREYDFEYVESFQDPQWGLCIRARGYV